jgi:ergothioneine biosynthesis protein EgtB
MTTVRPSEAAPVAPYDALVDRYRSVRAVTEELAAPLSAEDQTVQSMPDVSPTKWHRAHTSWFFETFVLGPNERGYRAFDPTYAYLFNSYYESVGDRFPRPDRGLLSRPGIADIAAYRAHVDNAMVSYLNAGPPPAVVELIDLGLHHEQQHQELMLMDIKHVLSVNPFHPVYQPARPRPHVDVEQQRWNTFDRCLVEIGHNGAGFAFDNEGPRHLEYVHPYALADRPVTCGEWRAFMADGGYSRPDLWLSDGWAMVKNEGWQSPLYWFEASPGDGDWHVFTLAGARRVDPTEPVCHISYYEADAFARWAGARLPTEVEWENAAASEPVVGRFLEMGVLHPRPGPSVFGDVWQWTSSAYLPYPGFEPAAGAVGEYNGKFMVNQHVLRGGACVTPQGHTRATYRNFFPPSARWPFTGLRLARDAS